MVHDDKYAIKTEQKKKKKRTPPKKKKSKYLNG